MSIEPTDIHSKKKFFSFKNHSKLFIIILIAVIVIENFIIVYVSPIENKIIYTNWILIINSALAAGLSIILVTNLLLQQKKLNCHSVTYITLSIGLILWFCANSEWVRYEIDEVVPDIPSLADILWISAYPFLGYSLYSTFKNFYKKYQNKRVFLMSLCSGILFVIYIYYIITRLSEFSTSNDLSLLSIMIVYPILNTILIVPAIVMFIDFKKEPKSSMPRMCESLSLLNLIVADSWFVIIFLSKMVEAIWYSNLLIVDHYLIISAGLLWSIIFLHPIRTKYNSFEWKNRIKFNNRIFKRIMLAIPILVLISSIFFVNLLFVNNSYSSQDKNEIKIGALLGLSGISSDRGKTQKAAMEEAVKDINENFMSKIGKKIQLYIEDTERKPEVALAKVKILADKGIRIIIGPQTSSELKQIEEYVNKHDILIISQSSTAPSLSKKGDHIFRLVQNDINQGKEIASKIWNDGIKLVIPMLRSDAYGNELYNATKQHFEKLGGTFSTNVIKYNPHIGKFAGSLHRINFIMWNQELNSLSLAISNATEKVSPENIGVYVIAYSEIVPILIQAQSHDNLKSINWYGSDGTAKNEHILKHNKAAEFVSTTKFLNPLMALNETNVKFQSLENDTNQKKLMIYDANAYDAIWVAALTENLSGCANLEKLTENFNKITNSYPGASGIIKLDDNGDRIGNYDFWTIMKSQGTEDYEWKKIHDNTTLK
jgi:ABC-type branched-subunit amino acid transport system substrate-binding protein